MFSCENNPFELEENYSEFLEICSRLKDHAFPSPWEIFFKAPDTEEIISEVSEGVIEEENVTKRDSNISSSPVDMSYDLPIDVKSNLRMSIDISVDKKKVSRLKESLMSAQDDSSIDSLKDFDIFFITASSQIPVLIEMLDVQVLNDNAISLLLNAFLHFKDQISIATAIAAVHFVICPLIFQMKKNSSRFLLTTILKFAEAYPKAVVDEIIIPYSKQKTLDDVQSEILLQIAKSNLPNEYISYTIKNVLEHALPMENSFALLQCLIERKVHHENTLYDLLLKKLLSWTSTCNSNVKFTKLLTSTLSAYGNEFTEQQLLLCDEVVKSNKTIIKKAAENLLKRLKHESS